MMVIWAGPAEGKATTPDVSEGAAGLLLGSDASAPLSLPNPFASSTFKGALGGPLFLPGTGAAPSRKRGAARGLSLHLSW